MHFEDFALLGVAQNQHLLDQTTFWPLQSIMMSLTKFQLCLNHENPNIVKAGLVEFINQILVDHECLETFGYCGISSTVNLSTHFTLNFDGIEPKGLLKSYLQSSPQLQELFVLWELPERDRDCTLCMHHMNCLSAIIYCTCSLKSFQKQILSKVMQHFIPSLISQIRSGDRMLVDASLGLLLAISRVSRIHSMEIFASFLDDSSSLVDIVLAVNDQASRSKVGHVYKAQEHAETEARVNDTWILTFVLLYNLLLHADCDLCELILSPSSTFWAVVKMGLMATTEPICRHRSRVQLVFEGLALLESSSTITSNQSQVLLLDGCLIPIILELYNDDDKGVQEAAHGYLLHFGESLSGLFIPNTELSSSIIIAKHFGKRTKSHIYQHAKSVSSTILGTISAHTDARHDELQRSLLRSQPWLISICMATLQADWSVLSESLEPYIAVLLHAAKLCDEAKYDSTTLSNLGKICRSSSESCESTKRMAEELLQSLWLPGLTKKDFTKMVSHSDARIRDASLKYLVAMIRRISSMISQLQLANPVISHHQVNTNPISIALKLLIPDSEVYSQLWNRCKGVVVTTEGKSKKRKYSENCFIATRAILELFGLLIELAPSLIANFDPTYVFTDIISQLFTNASNILDFKDSLQTLEALSPILEPVLKLATAGTKKHLCRWAGTRDEVIKQFGNILTNTDWTQYLDKDSLTKLLKFTGLLFYCQKYELRLFELLKLKNLLNLATNLVKIISECFNAFQSSVYVDIFLCREFDCWMNLLSDSVQACSLFAFMLRLTFQFNHELNLNLLDLQQIPSVMHQLMAVATSGSPATEYSDKFASDIFLPISPMLLCCLMLSVVDLSIFSSSMPLNIRPHIVHGAASANAYTIQTITINSFFSKFDTAFRGEIEGCLVNVLLFLNCTSNKYYNILSIVSAIVEELSGHTSYQSAAHRMSDQLSDIISVNVSESPSKSGTRSPQRASSAVHSCKSKSRSMLQHINNGNFDESVLTTIKLVSPAGMVFLRALVAQSTHFDKSDKFRDVLLLLTYHKSDICSSSMNCLFVDGCSFIGILFEIFKLVESRSGSLSPDRPDTKFLRSDKSIQPPEISGSLLNTIFDMVDSICFHLSSVIPKTPLESLIVGLQASWLLECLTTKDCVFSKTSRKLVFIAAVSKATKFQIPNYDSRASDQSAIFYERFIWDDIADALTRLKFTAATEIADVECILEFRWEVYRITHSEALLADIISDLILKDDSFRILDLASTGGKRENARKETSALQLNLNSVAVSIANNARVADLKLLKFNLQVWRQSHYFHEPYANLLDSALIFGQGASNSFIDYFCDLQSLLSTDESDDQKQRTYAPIEQSILNLQYLSSNVLAVIVKPEILLQISSFSSWVDELETSVRYKIQQQTELEKISIVEDLRTRINFCMADVNTTDSNEHFLNVTTLILKIAKDLPINRLNAVVYLLTCFQTAKDTVADNFFLYVFTPTVLFVVNEHIRTLPKNLDQSEVTAFQMWFDVFINILEYICSGLNSLLIDKTNSVNDDNKCLLLVQLLRALLQIKVPSVFQTSKPSFINARVHLDFRKQFNKTIKLLLKYCILEFDIIDELSFIVRETTLSTSLIFLDSLKPNTECYYHPCTLLSMLVSHSKFPFCLDDSSKSPLTSLAIMKLILISLSCVDLTQKIEKDFVDAMDTLHTALIATYRGTMRSADRVILRIFHKLHQLKISPSPASLSLNLNNSSADKKLGELNLNKRLNDSPSSNIFPSIQQAKVYATISQFPRFRCLSPPPIPNESAYSHHQYLEQVTAQNTLISALWHGEARENENLTEHYAAVETFVTDELTVGCGSDQVYDPSFWLPQFSYKLQTCTELSYKHLVNSGSLSLIVVCLSSQCRIMRIQALGCLQVILHAINRQQLSHDPTFKCKMQISMLLTFIKDSIDVAGPETSSIISRPFPMSTVHFLATSALHLMQPGHELYGKINKYLLSRPCCDVKDVPLFDYLVMEGDSETVSALRLNVLRAIRDSLVTQDDHLNLCRKNAYNRLMSLYSTFSKDSKIGNVILEILDRGLSMRSSSRYLIERCSLLSWIQQACYDELLVSKSNINSCNDPARHKNINRAFVKFLLLIHRAVTSCYLLITEGILSSNWLNSIVSAVKCLWDLVECAPVSTFYFTSLKALSHLLWETSVTSHCVYAEVNTESTRCCQWGVLRILKLCKLVSLYDTNCIKENSKIQLNETIVILLQLTALESGSPLSTAESNQDLQVLVERATLTLFQLPERFRCSATISSVVNDDVNCGKNLSVLFEQWHRIQTVPTEKMDRNVDAINSSEAISPLTVAINLEAGDNTFGDSGSRLAVLDRAWKNFSQYRQQLDLTPTGAPLTGFCMMLCGYLRHSSKLSLDNDDSIDERASAKTRWCAVLYHYLFTYRSFTLHLRLTQCKSDIDTKLLSIVECGNIADHSINFILFQMIYRLSLMASSNFIVFLGTVCKSERDTVIMDLMTSLYTAQSYLLSNKVRRCAVFTTVQEIVDESGSLMSAFKRTDKQMLTADKDVSIFGGAELWRTDREIVIKVIVVLMKLISAAVTVFDRHQNATLDATIDLHEIACFATLSHKIRMLLSDSKASPPPSFSVEVNQGEKMQKPTPCNDIGESLEYFTPFTCWSLHEFDKGAEKLKISPIHAIWSRGDRIGFEIIDELMKL